MIEWDDSVSLLALSHLFGVTMNEILVTKQPQVAATKRAPTSGSAPRWMNSIQEAASDHLWDYTFAAMDDNITNAVHTMVAPCSREK